MKNKFWNQPALVDIRYDGVDRYRIIEVDYSLEDAMRQVREIGCIQIDIGSTSRLWIKYLGNDENEQYPVIIHAAVTGGFERYVYTMLDNPKKHLPFLVRPIQVRLLPVSEKFIYRCEKLVKDFHKIRFEINDRSEGVSKKIKNCYQDYIQKFILVGYKEVANTAIEVRNIWEKSAKENRNYPFIQASISSVNESKTGISNMM